MLKTTLSLYIPLFGQNGMSVGISGIFSMLPAFLFGPVYGMIVSGLSDLLGYLLKPMGAYLPLMTLIVALGGFLRGALWARAARPQQPRAAHRAWRCFPCCCWQPDFATWRFLADDGLSGAFYDQADAAAVSTDNLHLVSRLLVARTQHTKDPAGNLATYLTFGHRRGHRQRGTGACAAGGGLAVIPQA